MKNKIIIWGLITFFAISPSHAQSSICVSPALKPILTSFVEEVNTDGKMNEIHVNRLDNSIYQIVIYSGDKLLTGESDPPISIEYEGTTFYLYSPLQHYFYSCDRLSPIENIQGPPNGIFWIVTDTGGVLKVEKHNLNNPFDTPLPMTPIPQQHINQPFQPQMIE